MRKILIFGVLPVVGIIAAFGFIQSGKPKGTEVFLYTVDAGSIRSEVSGTGEIQAKTKVNISSTIPGAIVSIPVKEGELVKRGAVLLQIDPESYRQDVQNLEAQLRQARVSVEHERARLDNATSRFQRAQQLQQQGLLSEEAFDQVELEFDSSRIQVRSLEESISQVAAALAKAKDELAKTTLYAPIAGKVTALNTEVGEQVIVGTTNVPGSVMMVISDMSELLAEIDVDEAQIARVAVGQAVNIKVDAIEGLGFRGRVNEIRNSARKKGDANVFGVKVLLADPDGRLRPGMSAKARIEIETRQSALRVPIQAIVERPESALGNPGSNRPGEKRVDAIVLMQDGKAKAVRVQAGLTDDDFVEVLAGVRDGDQVITGPYRTLRKLKDDEAVIEHQEPENASDDTSDDVSVEVS
jgi:HlyD family secretion protein